MKKKIIFLVAVSLLLLVPALTIDLRRNQISEFDNTGLPGITSYRPPEFQRSVEKFVEGRIGFRAEMITAYQVFCDRAFQKLVHPLYCYGKNGYVWMRDVVTYQHLDVDQDYVEDYADYVESLRNYCRDRDTEFLFYLCLNKETVYPEYFPDGYNIKDQPNRSERILNCLKEKNITYLTPKELFSSLKGTEQLYNVKFDAGHWNRTGDFYGQQQIIHYLNELFPGTGELKKDEFAPGQMLAEYLINSKFRVDEMVPTYPLVSTDAVQDQGIFDEIRVISPNNYYMRFRNDTAAERGAPKVMIFGDSYFGSSASYYLNHCGELVMLHSTNLPDAEYYISVFQPDIVIYEVVERQLLSEWDEFKREKRCYSLAAANNDETISVEMISLNTNLTTLKGEAELNEIVTLSGTLNEAAVTDPSRVFALKAVLNGKEYSAIFDKNECSYLFSFRSEDVAAASELSFYTFQLR